MTKELFALICVFSVTVIIMFSLIMALFRHIDLISVIILSVIESLIHLSDDTDKGESCSLKVAFQLLFEWHIY